MEIVINSLSLKNFKCFRDNTFHFNDKITKVKGRNGVGKTTIFDSFLFCLFGKNSQGSSVFNVKTHEKDGVVIPHLEHSVEVNLTLKDGEKSKEVCLKHAVSETWKKKPGVNEEVFAGDKHLYYIDGELCTAADYKKFIASIIDEQTFRFITNPQYFPSLHWKEQRSFLTKMVGDITNDEVADTDELKSLVSTLMAEGEDIVEYRKHLSYKIQKIKDQLALIPVRLEEQNKALPEKSDWDSVNKELTEKTKRKEEIDAQILGIKQGNSADIMRNSIRKKIEEVNAKISSLRLDATNRRNELLAEKNKALNEYSSQFSTEVNNQRIIEQAILTQQRMIERCKENNYEARLQELRDQWPNETFKFDDDLRYCPACGQTLPTDVFEEKVEDLRQKFNLRISNKKKELEQKAAKIKEEKEAALVEQEKLEKKLAEDNQKLEGIKEKINEIFKQKAQIEKKEVPTLEDILGQNEEFKTLQTEIAALQQELNAVTDNTDNSEMLGSLTTEQDSLIKDIKEYQDIMAIKPMYERIMKNIEGINSERKTLVNQLSELEKKRGVADKFEERQNAILEERVNAMFSITKWKMFKTVVNGGDSYNEPFCECYGPDGSAYHDGLNQAAALNVGLDIINVMCNFYNTHAPVIIDQSESTLNILPTTGQQIRLEVSDCDLLIE